MYKRKEYISLLFLTIFIFIKTVGIHSFIHFEDDFNDSECEVCEFVNTSNSPHHLANEQTSFEEAVLHNFKKQVFYEYSFQFTKNQADTTLFCRPPPVV